MQIPLLISFLALLPLVACGDKDGDTGKDKEVSCSGEGIDGQALFATHCSSCHGTDGFGGSSGPNLANMMGHHDDDFILETIDEGWEDMPAFNDTLSCDEQHAVLDFLRETHGEYTGEGHH